MREDQDACLAAGMNDYLAKPVNRQRLLERIDRWAGAPVERARPAAIDASVLDDLRAAFSDDEVKALITTFTTGLATFERELATLTPTALKSRAHQLRGSAGSLGFMKLSDAAAEVERALATHAPPQVALATARLGRLLGDTVRDLASAA
jgi:HPt (histidine-containing phosphotransfer) domain-containing protein